MAGVLEQVEGGLIVSCQAVEEEPFFRPGMMALFAESAELGGAVGIRAKLADIPSIKEACSLPVIGIDKVYVEGYDVYLTPRFEDAQRIAAAGADIIALDCTPRTRPGGEPWEQIVARIRSELKLPVMADIATLEEARAAEQAGADIVATTLSGYTSYAPRGAGPDFALLEAILRAVQVPVIAEGGFYTPEEVRAAIDLGAWAVVCGSAITKPIEITKRFVEALG
jgi:N-acylglucosamine-6-phosphate 2-epimerase